MEMPKNEPGPYPDSDTAPGYFRLAYLRFLDFRTLEVGRAGSTGGSGLPMTGGVEGAGVLGVWEYPPPEFLWVRFTRRR